MAKMTLIKRVKGLARLGVFTASVFAGIGLLAARSARSQAGEASVVIGREFASIGDLVKQGYKVRLNGEELRVGSTTVNLPTDEVLERFEALCRQGSHGFEEALKDPSFERLPDVRNGLNQLGILGLGVMRIEKGSEGTIACFVHPDRSMKGLTQRIAAFSQSFDLKDLGGLRYVYVRSSANRSRTQVITAWSEGSVRLTRLFTNDGDAPGSDPVGMPRPPQSVRRLTAEVDGAPYGVRLYESKDTAERVLKFYDEGMAAAGWESIETVTKVNPSMRTFSREGADVMLLATPGENEGDMTSVSLIELPSKATSAVVGGQ